MTTTFRVEPGVRVRVGSSDYVVAALVDLEYVLAKDLSTGQTSRIAVGDLKTPSGSVTGHVPPDLISISSEKWKEAERRYGFVQRLLTQKCSKKEVQDQARQAGVHWTTMYSWVKAYESTGLLTSLLPNSRNGGRGKSRLLPEIETTIQEVIQGSFLSTQRPSVTALATEINTKLRERGLQKVDAATVWRRVQGIQPEEKTRRREGARAAEEKHAPKPGRYGEGAWPLAVVQIDHTKLDVIVVDEQYRIPIGRPWLTIIIDVFSRMILGFYVSLDPPGTISVGLCLANAILPKDAWLARLGIEGVRWPVWGYFGMIHADNAKEFHAEMLKRACGQYGMDLQWRWLAKPHYGGHIESLIGTVAGEIHLLPGTTFSNPVGKGDYDPEKTAAFTLRELEVYLATWITKVYHLRPHSGLEGSNPVQRWEDGILGRNGFVATGIQTREFDEQRLRLDLMPPVERTISDRGTVEIDRVAYYDPVLRTYIGVHAPGRAKRKPKFLFRRDPRDISVVHFWDPETQQYHRIPFRNPAHPALSIWEYREAARWAREHYRGGIDEDAIFRAHAELGHQREASVAKTLTAKKTRISSALRATQRRIENKRSTSVDGSASKAPENAADDTPVAQPIVNVAPFDEIDEYD